MTTSDRWRLVIDDPLDGATNMARDEALLLAHAIGGTPPTLRLYRWRPACLSLGRFQRLAAVNRDACERAGVAIVRRPSGGRALLHDDEVTYTVIARADHALVGGASIARSYERIGRALLIGLQRLGAAAELAQAGRRRAGESAACFDAPSAYELVVGGRKLAGSAQTRHGGALLQHGAIPLAGHAERLAALLAAPPTDLGSHMLSLDAALGRVVMFEDVAAALIAGFVEAWGIDLERGDLTEAEQALAGQLRREKYASDAWTAVR